MKQQLAENNCPTGGFRMNRVASAGKRRLRECDPKKELPDHTLSLYCHL